MFKFESPEPVRHQPWAIQAAWWWLQLEQQEIWEVIPHAPASPRDIKTAPRGIGAGSAFSSLVLTAWNGHPRYENWSYPVDRWMREYDVVKALTPNQSAEIRALAESAPNTYFFVAHEPPKHYGDCYQIKPHWWAPDRTPVYWGYARRLEWAKLSTECQLELAGEVELDGSLRVGGPNFPMPLAFEHGKIVRQKHAHQHLAKIRSEIEAVAWLADRLGYLIDVTSLENARLCFALWREVQPMAGDSPLGDQVGLFFRYADTKTGGVYMPPGSSAPLRYGNPHAEGTEYGRVSLQGFRYRSDVLKVAKWFFGNGSEPLMLHQNRDGVGPTTNFII